LIEADDYATHQIFDLYYGPLIDWLRGRFPAVSWDRLEEAAALCMTDLMHQPLRFDPQQKSLRGYLCMAARSDLLNILRRDGKLHQEEPVFWNSLADRVAVGLAAGNGDGGELLAALERFQATLDDVDRLALNLMLDEERRTHCYVEACGLEHVAREDQPTEVKKLKDRLKKRLKRFLTSQGIKP
jgi:hypothetical protein